MNASDEGAFVMQYFYSTYFAFSLLSGFAPLAVEPETLLETMFSIAGVILGIILSAMVVSSATSALSNLDARESSPGSPKNPSPVIPDPSSTRPRRPPPRAQAASSSRTPRR